MRIIILLVFFLNICQFAATAQQTELFSFDGNLQPRWSSPENRNGRKGGGGKENHGAKGHPFDSIAAGRTLDLLNIKGQGIVNRIWITINDRSPEMLQGLKIEMYWDNAEEPAVAAPFGDFFNMAAGRTVVFQNALFANPEGRSFQCFIPMPFRKAAKIRLVNTTGQTLTHIFFDVDYNLATRWNPNWMYFHASWQESAATVPGQDFVLLPAVKGRGRYLGTSVGVKANSRYGKNWWGEGEVKIYLDGDKDWPTLIGTGTEDYIGTAWGQGHFANAYSGCLLADDSLNWWSFYRFHIPDPIFFRSDCRITWQQIGGGEKNEVKALMEKNVPLIPVGMDTGAGALVPLHQPGKLANLSSISADGWVNYYRSDNVSAVTYYYLDRPGN
jgi:hypothetical protein